MKIKKYLWPGFSENMRVLEWIFNRTEVANSFNNENKQQEKYHHTALGYIPSIESFNTKDLNLSEEILNELFQVKPENWKDELESQKEFLKKLEILFQKN